MSKRLKTTRERQAGQAGQAHTWRQPAAYLPEYRMLEYQEGSGHVLVLGESRMVRWGGGVSGCSYKGRTESPGALLSIEPDLLGFPACSLAPPTVGLDGCGIYGQAVAASSRSLSGGGGGGGGQSKRGQRGSICEYITGNGPNWRSLESGPDERQPDNPPSGRY